MPRLKMYDKSSTEAWECSRTAIDEFLNDPHTFVMRRKFGLMSVPSFPLNLNTATDEILKADFDALRNVQECDYWLFAKYNLNIVQQINHSRDEIAYNVIDIEADNSHDFKELQKEITMNDGVLSSRILFGLPGVGYSRNIDGDYHV